MRIFCVETPSGHTLWCCWSFFGRRHMTETEYKEKAKVEDDKVKVERESKDEFGNKVKEKHEVKTD
jgi:hypothetical protein